MDVYASASENKEDDSFSSIIANLNKDAIREGFGLIEALMERVMQFTNGWLQNQAVWKLNPKEIAESMGSNVDMWQKLLSGLSKAKADLESESIEKVIGCVHVNLEQVQSSMSIRYDALQKDLLTSFSELVLEQTKQFSQVLSSTRSELERLSVNASTNETINLILLVREVVHNLQTWKSQKNALMNCQVLLDNQNYNYPSEWIYSQKLENDWSSLEQILNRRQESIKASQEQLKKNIIMEDNKVKKAIDEATSQWEQNRPLDGSIPVQNALTTLEEFKLKFDSLNDQWSKVNKGRDALSLDVHRESPVDLLLTELHGLQEAWQAVLEYWNRLNGVGETMWSMFIPKTFNQQLNELEKDLESIPSRSKQYACFTYLQTTIRRYKKEFKLLQELKNSSLKERHWSQILSFLNLSTSYEFLRVRDFWTPEFQENEQKITDVLSIAQGELAIEEFLKQIREFWNAYQLELVSYQGRCKLIRGWEALFQKLDEHISALSSMKQSPYYRVFAEEADDSFFFDDEPMYVPEVSFREAYQREPVRPVTMYELIDAFEDARKEIEIQRERERVRAELKAKEPKTFQNKAHEEDDEQVIEAVWRRIERLGTGQISIRDLYTGSLDENITVFVSVLHLVRDGRLAVWQDDLPRGEIYVEIKTEWTSGTIEDTPGGRIPEAVI